MDLWQTKFIYFLIFFIQMALSSVTNNFKLCSFNCCSLRKNIDVVRSLTQEEYDLIFLQETMVVEDKLGIFDFVRRL